MISINQLLESKSRQLFIVTAEDTVSTALEMLAKEKIGAVMVMDGPKLVGILSERDCAIKVALPGRSAKETKVSEIMTKTVITVDPSQPLESCMKQMNDGDIRHLPVVEGGQVTGMVSIGDVSKEMLKLQTQLISQLEAYIRGGFSV